MTEQDSEELRGYLFGIMNGFKDLKTLFSDLMEQVHPIDIIDGDTGVKYVAESELSDTTTTLKSNLKSLYRLLWSMKNKLNSLKGRGLLVCDNKFIGQFNLTIQTVLHALEENNGIVINLGENGQPPIWFNTQQSKEISIGHTPHLTIQIVYNECCLAAKEFFEMASKLKKIEPKIELVTKPANLITDVTTQTLITSLCKQSKEINAVKAEATAELRKTHPDAFII